MQQDRDSGELLQPGQRVGTDQRFEIIRVLWKNSGQADIYLARLVRPRMLLRYDALNRLLVLLGEPKWLIQREQVFALKVARLNVGRDAVARELRALKLIHQSDLSYHDYSKIVHLYTDPDMPQPHRGMEQDLWPVALQLSNGSAREAVAIALEYLAGGSLNDLLSLYNGKLPYELAVQIAIQIADGLLVLHEGGPLVHQDLSPGNVMLRHQLSSLWPSTPDIVVIDLAAADSPYESEQLSRQPLGKQIYLAPERAQHPYLLHFAADVFSLGAVLYHMLAGQPETKRTGANTTGSWQPTEFTSLYQQAPDIPDTLKDLVMRCLQDDWRRRPTLSDLREQLLQISGGQHKHRVKGRMRPVDKLSAALMACSVVLLALVLALTLNFDAVSADEAVPTVTPLPRAATRIVPTPTPTMMPTSTPIP